MASRKQSVTSGGVVRTQSASGPPVQQTVRVAVLPPRLPANMAPPTGIAAGEAISYNETINWRHNESIDHEDSTQPKKRRPSTIFSNRNKAANEDTPPFIFREVPYDVWRKHYAKDAKGRYHGTLAPAEDCLLLPEDVEKWRLGEAKTKADQWTRGKEALPVYAEARQDQESVPAYTEHCTGPSPDETRIGSNSSYGEDAGRNDSTFMADGKTSAQIIQEAEERAKNKDRKASWKAAFSKGVQWTMGAG